MKQIKFFLFFLFLLFSFELQAVLVGPTLRTINASPGDVIPFYEVCDQLFVDFSFLRPPQYFTLTINSVNYTQIPAVTLIETGTQGCSKSIKINSSAQQGAYIFQIDIFTTQSFFFVSNGQLAKPQDNFQIEWIYTINVGPGASPTPVPTPTPSPTPSPIPTPSPPPVDEKDSCSILNESTINIDSLSLSESVAIVAAPFKLVYSSDRFRAQSVFQPKNVGLGGLTPSILHFYDISKKRVYYGNGGIRNIEAISTNAGYYITNESGSEVYYFDTNGKHVQTKDGLLGNIKYNFSYDNQGRITTVSDQFNNTTTFTYSSAQVIIATPYGQMTELNLDANGFLSSVKNSNNEIVTLTINSEGYLTSFKKPGGQLNQFIYDADGYLIKDVGAGGNFIALLRSYDAQTKTQTVTKTTALDRESVYQIISTDLGSQHHIVNATGTIFNSHNTYQSDSGSDSSYGESISNQFSSNARFGWLAPFNTITTKTFANSNLSVTRQTNQTVQLADTNNPLSVQNLTTKTVLNNDPSRTFISNFDGNSRALTFTSPEGRVIQQSFNSNGQISKIQIANLNPFSLQYDLRGRITQINYGNRIQNFSYNNFGNLSAITDSLGHKTQFEYDLTGRVTKRILPNDQFIDMSYDPNGNLTSITPPQKMAHNFNYNLFEILQGYNPPSVQSSNNTTYEYNFDKQLIKINRPDGKSVTFDYDEVRGLLNSITSPDANYSFNYLSNSDLIQGSTSPDGDKLKLLPN